MKLMALMLMSSLIGESDYAPDIDFSDYHTPAQVAAELANLQATFPTLASLSTIGMSVEGRPIQALKISDNVATDDPDEDDIVFVAAHHAREWISVETALYLAEYLLKNYSVDASLKADIDNLEIWIIPIVNPDGVEHTWATGGYRYWRKNRRDNGDGSHGVDLNRNWGFQWGLTGPTIAASSTTTDDVYFGTGPFSEPETTALRNFLQGLDHLEAFVTYHSFSELWLRPWSYTNGDPPGEQTLDALTDRSIARIAAVHGHTYAETIGYNASGEATDYVWNEMRVASFTPELRPATGGLAGFSPPPSEIIPTAEENTPAALALIHDAAAREVWIRDHASDTGAEPSAVWTGTNWTQPFWTSPDIWTDPPTLDQGATVDLNVRINNNTGSARTNVRVDVYYTDPRISLEFPNPSAVLIGTRTVTVPPSGRVVTIPWTVPIGTNSWGERHWCVGAVVQHDDDLPLTTQAQRTSNIGIRNFNTTEVVVGGSLIVAAENFLEMASELVVNIDRESIPPGWRVTLPQRPDTSLRRSTTATERKARLLNARGLLLEPGETVLLPVRVEPPPDVVAGTEVDIHVHAALLPLVAGERTAMGNGFTYRVVAGKKCDEVEGPG